MIKRASAVMVMDFADWRLQHDGQIKPVSRRVAAGPDFHVDVGGCVGS